MRMLNSLKRLAVIFLKSFVVNDLTEDRKKSNLQGPGEF